MQPTIDRGNLLCSLFNAGHNTFPRYSTMTKGKKICEDLCWAIVRMRLLLPMETCIQISGVSERQIHRIIRTFETTGKPFVEAAAKSGRPTQLSSDEVGVCDGVPFISFTTDHI